MGVALKDMLVGKELALKDLSGKIICMDTSMLLYQFLTTIRQADGDYFTDSKGNITSHLIGLMSRISKLMREGLKLVFVFDGKPPELKKQEIERRKTAKTQAAAKYKEAASEKDTTEMRKYAARATRVTPEIIAETKRLVKAFGLPVVEAPSEAEAQATFMVKQGDAYAVATQDADPLMFGCPKVIRNLSLVGKHKRSNKLDYQTYKPELFELSEVLNGLGIDHKQFVLLCILIGTDFNPGGIKGIGPKHALKQVKEYANKEALVSALKDRMTFDFSAVHDIVTNIPIRDDYKLEWKDVDETSIRKLLVEEHEFSSKRVEDMLESLQEYSKSKQQTNLSAFIS